jgi:hypothetical protein
VKRSIKDGTLLSMTKAFAHVFLQLLVTLLGAVYGFSGSAQSHGLDYDVEKEIGLVGPPKVENGRVVGVLIRQPGTLLKALGIQEGEAVVQLNGESLADAASVLVLIDLLANAQAFEVIVESTSGARRVIRCASRLAISCSGP